MVDKIFDFVGDVTNSSPIMIGTSLTFKIMSKGNNRIIWFMRDNFIGDFNVWITDVGENIDVPWKCPSTMAYAARYKIDLSRREPNTGKMSSDISKMMSELSQAYSYRMQNYAKKNPVKMRLEYDILRERQKAIRENYILFKDDPKWYRVDGVNMFHVCATLKYSLATPTTKSYKWLDCNYTDGNFMFSVYTDDIPNTTRNLVIGDFGMYSGEPNQCFLLANSAVIQSNTSYSDFHSGFFLEDEWGVGRESRSNALYSLAYDTMKEKREALKDITKDIDNKKREIDAKKREITQKENEIGIKENEIAKLPDVRSLLNTQIDNVMGDISEKENAIQQVEEQIQVVTDPNELARLYKLKNQYEQEKAQLEQDLADLNDKLAKVEDDEQQLQDELDQLKDELDQLKSELEQLENELEQLEEVLKNGEKAWCIDDDSPYMKILDKALEVAPRPSDYNHTKRNIIPEKYSMDYESYLFAGLRFDADYDKDGDDEYCLKLEEDGEEEWYAFRWHVNKSYLKIYNLYPPYSPSWPVIKNLTSQKQVAWEYQLGHLTYEEFSQTDTPNYFPELDTVKQSYRISDVLKDEFKTFTFFKRSGYGGNSVNHNNNLSQLMPIIWYVQRDDEHHNDWSAIGQSDIINYVNMYNMGTGRLLQPQYPEPQNRYVNYNLWRRRPRWTDWIDECNDVKDSLKSIYGFGGYPGIGFKLNEKEDLDELERRVHH